tara:strand:- start:87 stop:266 length:180 start_codon:yes stop_codon:yes gene_type:complete
MNKMTITSAQYVVQDGENTSINAKIDGVQMNVPLFPGNRHYDEIQRQVAAGELTIADAD